MQGLELLGAGLLGLLVGVWSMIAFHHSQRVISPPVTSSQQRIGEDVASILAILPSAVVVLDGNDELVRANASAYVLGVVRHDAVLQADVTRLVADARRTGGIITAELELPRGPVGSGVVPVHVRVAPIGVDFVLLLVDDRSEARRIDAVRRDFVANISHELKTPVGALALLAETVDSAAADPVTVTHFAKKMRKEAHRLGLLVNEIIELSRVQSAGALSDFELLAIDDVVAEAVDAARTRALAREISIEVKGEEGLEVFGERGLLVAAIRNLVDNAVSYSDPHTHITIALTADGELVSVAVIDQGIGIAAKNLERVFERFYRVDPARSRDTGGTGLGLSIVKHVVNEHGGDVSAWSQPGQGSTFTMRLPLAQPPLDSAAAAQIAAQLVAQPPDTYDAASDKAATPQRKETN